MPEITTKINELIDKPRSTSSDAGSVTNISVDDLIKADKYLAQKDAAANQPKRMGIRVGVLRGPGHF